MKKLFYTLAICILSLNMAFSQEREIKTNLEVGSIPSGFSVSPTGASTYSMQIELPKGIADVTPNLGFVYSSHASVGNMGKGWSLGGLSVISRTNSTKYFNDYPKPVNFADDQLVLDGKKLILIDQQTDEYRFEVDNFTKIVRVRGQKDPQLTNDYFIVYTKGGIIKKYGSTPNSQLVYGNENNPPLMWHLNKIQDRYGNTIEYNYTRNIREGFLYLESIDYTSVWDGNIRIKEAQYTVKFSYVPIDEEDQTLVLFSNGSTSSEQYQYKLTNRLSYVSIVEQSTGIVISKYSLTYTPAGYLNENFLQKITLSREDKQLNSTIFDWSYFVPASMSEKGIFGDSWDFEAQISISAFVGDLNNDGIDDLIFERDYNFYSLELSTDIKVKLSDGTNLEYSPETLIPIDIKGIGDFNGDGNAEILYATIDDDNGVNRYHLIEIVKDENSNYHLQVHNDFFVLDSETNNEFVVDLNGDGLMDFIGFNEDYKLVYNAGAQYTFFEGIQLAPYNLGLVEDEYDIQVGDFDGEGKQEILVVDWNGEDCRIVELNTQNDGFIEHLVNISIAPTINLKENQSNDEFYKELFSDPNEKISVSDLNTDGKTDVLVGNKIFLSFGYDFVYMQNLNILELHSWHIEDVNNDKIPDIIDIDEMVGPSNDAVAYYYFGTRQGLDFIDGPTVTLEEGGVGQYIILNQSIFGNISGTGKKELICSYTDPSDDPYEETFFYVEAYNYINESIDKISKITNGLGREVKITYAPLALSDNFSNNIVIEDANLKVITPNIYIVSKFEKSNGMGGFFPASKYTYNDAVFHRGGKGFLGFMSYSSKDVRTHSLVEIDYSFYKPNGNYYHKYISSQKRYTLDKYNQTDKLVSETIKDLNIINTIPDKPRVYFYYNPISTTNQYDPTTGQLLKVIEVESKDFDDYGNPLTVTMTKRTPGIYGTYAHKSTSTSQYWNDPDNWMLARLTNLTVTKEYVGDPNSIPITKNSTFSYYNDEGLPNYGKIKTEVLLPEEALSNARTYEYDDYGNTFSIISDSYWGPNVNRERKITTVFNADYNFRFPTVFIDALEKESSREYNKNWGWLTKQVDPNGFEILTDYNDNHFKNHFITLYPDGTESEHTTMFVSGDPHEPNNTCYLVKESVKGGNKVLKYYDNLNRLLRTATIGFNGEYVYSDISYNNGDGLISYSTAPYRKGEEVQKTYYTYDNSNRIIEKLFPENRKMVKQYNGLAINIVNPNNQKETMHFNTNEKLTHLVDNGGNTTKYVYDPFGNILETKVEGHDNTKIICEYDKFGRLKKIDDPAIGEKQYWYNFFGEIIQQSHNSNIELTNVEYDNLGRNTQFEEPFEGNTVIKYDEEFYGLPDEVSFVDNKGNTNKIKYFYDELARNRELKELVSGYGMQEEFITKMTYDEYSRPSTLEYPSGFTVINHYTSFGHLKEVRNNDDGALLWKLNNANARGQIESIYLGNGTATSYGYYEETGLPESILTSSGGLTKPTINDRDIETWIQDFHYQWDDIGNLLQRRKNIQYSHTLVEDFEYDELNRLEQIDLNYGQAVVNMGYDALGRVLKKQSETPDFHVADNYSYDLSGTNPYKLIGIDNRPAFYEPDNQNITYNSFDKIISIEQPAIAKGDKVSTQNLEMFYGIGHSRKMQHIVDGQSGHEKTKIYIGALYEKEIDDGEEKEVHYLFAAGDVFAIYNKSKSENGDEVLFVHKDHLGSIQCLTNERGSVVEEYSYDAWGLRRNPDTWIPYKETIDTKTDRGFTGHEHLDIFDLINMNGRVYDPVIGYFSSPDPTIGIPKNSQGFNMYTYVKNNPLSFVDPSGYLEVEMADIGAHDVISPKISNYVQDLAEGGAFSDMNATFAGAYAAAFDAAIENGTSKLQAHNAGMQAGATALKATGMSTQNANKGAIRSFNRIVRTAKRGSNIINRGNKGASFQKGQIMGVSMANVAKSTDKTGHVKFNFSSISLEQVSAGTFAIVGAGNSANAGGTTYAVIITEEAGGVDVDQADVGKKEYTIQAYYKNEYSKGINNYDSWQIMNYGILYTTESVSIYIKKQGMGILKVSANIIPEVIMLIKGFPVAMPTYIIVYPDQQQDYSLPQEPL